MPKKHTNAGTVDTLATSNENIDSTALSQSPSNNNNKTTLGRTDSRTSNRTSIDTTTTSPRQLNSTFSFLQRNKADPLPTYKSDFPTPGLPYLQKGGYYSQPETVEGPVKGCPNVENKLHVCTAYCVNHYGALTTKEKLLQRAQGGTGGSQSCCIT